MALCYAAFATFDASVALGAKAPAFHRDETKLPSQLSNPSNHAALHSAGAGGALARTIVGLGIVLAVVFGIYWLLKTYGKSRTGAGDGRLEILATTPLAPNRALHLVRVGDGLVLVGSAEGGITPIRTYSPEESELLKVQLEGESELYALGETPGGRPSFGAALVDNLRKRTARR